MNKRVLMAALTLAAVFLLGAVAGAGFMRMKAARFHGDMLGFDGGRRGEWRMRALAKQLDLSDEQRAKVKGILAKHAPERDKRMKAAMETCGAPLEEFKAKVDGEIRAVLTPEQQKKFDAIAKRQAERMFFPGERRGRRHRGGDSGGDLGPPPGGPPPF